MSRQICNAVTFSVLYVPFIHAVLRSGHCENEIATLRSLSPEHALRWDNFVSRYRHVISTSVALGFLLSAQNVQEVNEGWDAVRPMPRPWPYLPAAEETDGEVQVLATGEVGMRWPPRGANNERFTQEGVLSQDPLLFHQLQVFFREWQAECRDPQQAGV